MNETGNGEHIRAETVPLWIEVNDGRRFGPFKNLAEVRACVAKELRGIPEGEGDENGGVSWQCVAESAQRKG